MEWTESLKRSINFMENHLLEDISPDDVAAEVHISSFYLQKGFSIMTGYSSESISDTAGCIWPHWMSLPEALR